MPTRSRWVILASVLILIALGCGACGSVEGQASYKPPLLPLRVSVNTDGKVTLSAEGKVKIPTLLGEFEVGIVANPLEYFQVSNILIVRLNGKDYFYDLHGEDFDVRFDPGYYEQVSLQKTGEELLLVLQAANAGISLPSPTPIIIPTQPSEFVSTYAIAGENTRVWSEPNVKQGHVIMPLSTGTRVQIVGGPARGPIRYDSDIEDIWYQIQLPGQNSPLGWVWGARLIF